MRLLFDANGSPLRLSREIGRGGEGAVFEIPGNDLVAKIYHRPISPDKAAKLKAMTQYHTLRLLDLAAWPISLLMDRSGREVHGIVMRRIEPDYRDAHKLYSPKSRRTEFPKASFAFLVRAATNIARAFAVVHESGHVIGDVNHGNALVSPRATVKLIDCDSYQIAWNGNVFLCEVGVPTYTPPELHGAVFKRVRRTANHDAFGLAVLIFHFLFMGRHPFAGRFHGNGDMPIEKAIHELRFAYGSAASRVQMSPPPNTLSFGELGPRLAGLFEASFSREAIAGWRPTALEWVGALEELEKALQSCKQNPAHHFPKEVTACPWCRIEKAVGISLFGVYFRSAGAVPGFDIERVWKHIQSIPPPSRLATIPSPAQFMGAVSRTLRGQEIRRNRLVKLFQGVSLFIGGFASPVFLDSPWAGYCLVLGIVLGILLLRKGNDLAEPLRSEHTVAMARYDAAVSQWRADVGAHAFEQRLRALAEARNTYVSLPNLRAHKWKQLEAELYSRQLEHFLERYKIEYASIPGIGSGRKDLLASFGIEDAADITPKALYGVPGFGDKLSARLFAWRKSLEQQFVFNPQKGVDPRDVQAIEQEIQATRFNLERTLNAGPSELLRISTQITVKRQLVVRQMEAAAKDAAQAQVDLRLI